eukprot:3692672-Karenia_brevis.AAC.1
MSKRLCYGQVFGYAQEKAAAVQLRSLIKLDELARLDKHAQAIECLFDASDPVQMYAHIAKYLPKAKKSSVFINNPDGTPAGSLVQHKSNF